MPSYQSVFKDTTPAIVYSSEWSAVSSEEDPLLDHFGQATATFTNATGATMTLRFFGNGVGIYGSKRPGHGLYNVTIDGTTYPTFDGSSTAPLFNQTLFNTTLDNGPHTMVLTNLGNSMLDIDYLALNGFVGTPDETMESDTFQDTHPNFQYTGNWFAAQRPGTYSGSSAHITRDPRATVRHTFQVSTAVFLYGTISTTACSAYSVSLDGGPFYVYSARKEHMKPHQVLYHANGLGPGTHNILVQFNTTDNSTSGDFNLDFSNIYTLPSLGGSSLMLKSQIQSQFNELPRSAIIGLSITSVVGLLALLAVGFLLIRQKRVPSKGLEVRQKSITSDKTRDQRLVKQ